MAEQPARPVVGGREANTSLAAAWRAFGRIATAVAVLSAPAVFFWFHRQEDFGTAWSVVFTIFVCVVFRGLVDVLLRRVIPWPSLFGIDSAKLTEEDATNRRRAWFWRYWVKLVLIVGGLFCLVTTVLFLAHTWTQDNPSWAGDAGHIAHSIANAVSSSAFWIQILILPLFFVINFAILFGPLMMMGASQIRGFEPGDAKWGVKLEDVRGQAEAKEEIRRIVSLWESGEAFERAGGKRERGILFFGAPGTGKTMLAKAIATSFNCPIVTIPGSGFAQTFIGMDAVIVRWMARKAKKLARKWGGQCIVFIDEIDAVGMRRQALGGGAFMPGNPLDSATAGLHDLLFFGPNGALNHTGDMILESRAWRERLFAERAPGPRQVYPPWVKRLSGIVNQVPGGIFGGGMGGGLALNQLLVVMDGIDNPPFFRRVFTNRLNQILDVTYVIPRRLGKVPLRLPPAKPGLAQIYFIGATNVPLDRLDPALTRPGRMGRHVWFRTPTKDDRKDIFDLYLAKVAHDPELDQDRRRDEIARITNGYSPAMIEQVCSMALTYAHHDGREYFEFADLVEAMTTVESGSAINQEYPPEETRAVAIHEAGHAIASHVYVQGQESVRLSIRHRGGSLGHHQAMDKEERFSAWRHEEVAKLIWGLGAMAAERVFYGDTSIGVSGDLQSATTMAAAMVGIWGMGPEPIELNGRFKTKEEREEALEKISQRFEKIGVQLMARASMGLTAQNPLAAVLGDRDKRSYAAQLLGQAYLAAHLLMEHNRAAVEKIADVIVAKKEIFGDELLELLNAQNLEIPYVDLTKDEVWPTL